MATKNMIIDHTWTKVTGGPLPALVQIIGSADVCDSPVQPAEDHACHPMSNILLNVSAPTVLWVRSSWYESTVRVVVS